MKIGFDAKRAFLNTTGLGNYSRWLIKAVSSYYPENNYWLYTTKINRDLPLNFLNVRSRTKVIKPVGKYLTSFWRAKWIVDDLEKHNLDIYHGLSHELPIGIKKTGIKSVVTVHDLIFMRFPQQFGWINYIIYRFKLRYACKAADRIIAISQKTKDDLIQLLHTDPNKIEVIYQGCDPAFKKEFTTIQKNDVRAKYHLPERFLLTVGTIEKRKNLLLAVKALKSVESNLSLVVIGKPTAYLQTVKAYIDKNKLDSRVIFLHEVTYQELPLIYQLADIFIYPSRYEGFGIPVLEAINCGVPVIAATGSCLEETGGPASLYVDPDDDKALAGQIHKILDDASLRNDIVAKGYEHAQNFTDDKLAKQLMSLYQTLIKDA